MLVAAMEAEVVEEAVATVGEEPLAAMSLLVERGLFRSGAAATADGGTGIGPGAETEAGAVIASRRVRLSVSSLSSWRLRFASYS